ncbi:nuclear pore complex protein NUP1-like isoform X2 [Durio zibethinus]|uniref:Nuclear pore complex protein NUP1-like isoform X2 n=1 Tax=Durio zibethinus TaxID=66656 RepID=A0A6P5YNG9_DURZI|nr:nuclear pore complex protein NUP1-like isoform X2 [Durio zibethinus]
MATAREESNPYDGELGVGGKFRKRPFWRTTHTTPYDRPPTSIMNPTITGDRNGWLSKLVDPAQRLITYSAHMLFASVFRKRLPPPPPPPPQAPESETNQEVRENPPAATSTNPSVVQGADMGCEDPSNHTDEGGVAELEKILKQKTFTRPEIDHLTSLLRSRTVDIPSGNEEKRSKVEPVVSYDKKENFPKTPVRENGTENHLISTPFVSSTVLDEDVASPAELAKAYMGSRPSKVSVSMLGLHNQVPRGDSALPSNKIFPSKSPMMSLVPTSSGHVGSLGNGSVTSRSRGRSAIYSMARTPYSRVNSVTFLKGAGTANDAFGGPSSSSQSAWEQNRISGSRQGVLKRRSSVLENDIGSIGPIRRIRQKYNFLSSKNLSLPASTCPLSIHVGGTSSAGLDALAENGDNCTPGTSFTPVPSKSSEMASKILQQLDKLVSPGEKSPTKLLPSMLRGQSLKSLENVDSSKFLENMHDSEKLNGSHTALPDIQDSKSHKRDEVKENGTETVVALPNKSLPAVNGVDTGSLVKANNEPNVKAADSSVIKSVVQLPQQKRRAFQMSTHENYLDLDDDDFPNGATSATFGEGREGLDYCVMGSKSAAAEAILVEKPSSLSEVKLVSSSAFNQEPDLRTSDESALDENNAGVTFPLAQVATSSVPAALLVSLSTSTANKDSASGELKSTSPVLSFGEKVAPAKQSDAAASTFGFGHTNVVEVSSAGGSSGVKLATSSDQKLENSSSFATTVPGTTNYLSDKTDKENTLNGIFFGTPETAISCAVSTSTSAGFIFKSGDSKNGSTLNNGSLASSPFSFSSPMPSLVPNNGQSSSSSSTNYMSFTTNSDTLAAATTTSTTADVTVGSTSISMDVSVSSFTAAPVFKFASSGDPSASVSTLSATSGEATEAKTQDTSCGNVAIVPFGGASAFPSFGSNIFGSTSAITGTVSSTSGCPAAVVTSSGYSSFNGTPSNITNSGSGFFSSTLSTGTNTGNGIFSGTSAVTDTVRSTGSSIFSTTPAITSTGSNIFGFSAPAASRSTTQTQGLNPFNAVNTQASAAGTGIGTSTQSMPIQFSSSASSPSFGLVGNTTFSSGNSVFESSASVAKPFGSGATFGMSSSSSETNSLSSSSGIASGTFGSNWQAPKTPIFGSLSSGFSLGSSASVTALSSAPTILGSSTGASSSSIFSFTSAAASTPSQSVFGNTSPGLMFGSTPSGNNDQMEDSMAEDTVQASSPTVPTFGQQPISPPASGFVFGASNPSGASSFQFGGQPSIATPANPSPFQASGSLEFGAGGSFSLGTGGSDKSARKYVKVRRQRKK